MLKEKVKKLRKH